MAEIGTVVAHIFLFVSLYFEVFLLVTFIERRKEVSAFSEKPLTYPSVTVIVPCWNEGKTLAKTIRSLLSIEYPKEKLSIFAIDDGSTDDTWEKLQEFKDVPGIKLFKKENGGKFTALNLGIENSTSEIVGCLDADSIVAPDALSRIVKHFENPEIAAVTPGIRINEPKNIIERIQVAEYTFSAFIRKVFSFLGTIYITPGPFSFFRREVFKHIGPYRHAHNTEDLEIALRLQSKHYKIENAHNAFVYTNAPKTPRALYRQRVRWIHGFLENAKDYRSIFFKREYGDLSLFILPIATLSIFTALFFTAFAIWNGIVFSINKSVEISAVGLGLMATPPRLDWFFISTESVLIISMILVILTVALIMIGRYILDRRVAFSRDIVYFLVFYSFLAPFWLARSVYNTAFARKTSWR